MPRRSKSLGFVPLKRSLRNLAGEGLFRDSRVRVTLGTDELMRVNEYADSLPVDDRSIACALRRLAMASAIWWRDRAGEFPAPAPTFSNKRGEPRCTVAVCLNAYQLDVVEDIMRTVGAVSHSATLRTLAAMSLRYASEHGEPPRREYSADAHIGERMLGD